MSAAGTPPTSWAHRWQTDAPIISLTVNGQGSWVAAALADGRTAYWDARDPAPPRYSEGHAGVALSVVADADGLGFLSAGDDGRLLLLEPSENTRAVLHEERSPKGFPIWLDQVAASAAGGWRAVAAGKDVILLDAELQPKARWSHPSSIGGLAFSPRGQRLAVAHYGGVSLWWAKADANQQPVVLPWKGSHLSTLWHPDGKMLLTSMQEPALHGWRLSDQNEMRMMGYSARVNSWGWTADQKWLATAGAGAAICWPFFGGGPWGKTPMLVGAERTPLVSQVAPHPADPMLAIGYEDGLMLLCPLDERMGIQIHPALEAGQTPDENRVVGMVWAAESLYAALANGVVLCFTLASVQRAVQARSASPQSN